MVREYNSGGKEFVEGIKEQIGVRENGKRIIEEADHFELREESDSYGPFSG
ncbi:MAG TPA: hypothetical protein VGB26_06770 [Nitrospiria bacterium]